MIPGVILAAGRSARMGRPKALLTLPDGASFVRHLTATLLDAGIPDVFVVGRPDDEPLRTEVETLDRARYVENPRADEGQLTSLVAGLNAADHPGIAAILVTPVDLPLISPSSVRELLTRFGALHPPIARATHGARHGHPVVFARAIFDELRRADPAAGARAVIRARGSAVLDVEVNDPGVLRDVDTPQDYERLLNP